MVKRIRLMHAKLHRVTVTEANVDYIGSITIDRDLIDKVGILPLQEVDVVNVNNGKRWSTYVIPGEPGKGEICSNGAAALLCKPGDILIVIAYEECDRDKILKFGHEAKVAIADSNNKCQKLIIQRLSTLEGKIIVSSESSIEGSNI